MGDVLELSGGEAALAAAALAAAGLWLVAAAAVHFLRKPPEPPVGPRTLDLGQEPPAVANFLVNDFRVTPEAVPATVVDLAARNVVDIEQRGPGTFFVRLRAPADEPLTPYEQRVLEHLRRRARDGAVPADGLTTGPTEEASRWRRAFEGEVVADAKARGLSRDALDGRAFTALTAAATVPAALVWALWAFQAAILVLAAVAAILGWIQAKESDTRAWSAHGGRWRPVRISYPRLWPFAWGLEPLAVVAAGFAAGLASALVLAFAASPLLDAAPSGWGAIAAVAVLLVPGTGVLVGVAAASAAWQDLRAALEVTGPILRLRSFGDEKRRRYYVAVDDGVSPVIRAWRVRPGLYAGLEQGDVVTVSVTRNLGCVRSLLRTPDARMPALQDE